MVKKKVFTTLAVLLFVVYTAWWVWLTIFISPEDPLRNYFTDTYGVIAGLGGIVGLIIARKWDGMKSLVGKSLVFFSVGLLFQFLGQLSYSIEFYIYHIENSYPSFGEIFFVLSIPAYILGVYYIAKASGSAVSLRSFKNRIGSIILPLLMMAVSYFMFIRGNLGEEMPALETFLLFFYPLGQAVFVSFAALSYYLTGNVLGGVMRKRVFFILFALIFQYAADSIFLYKSSLGTWYPGDISEFSFVLSYFLMTMAFIQYLSVYEALKKAE
jgi:hypothetical protein